MIRNVSGLSSAIVLMVVIVDSAVAVPPFSEDFSSGTAGWRFTSANAVPLLAEPAGGADGGAFVRNNLASLVGSAQSPNTILLFRAHKTYAGIDLGYTGDWIAAGIQQVTAFVRHDAPQPLEFIARFAPESNFPGAFYATSPLVSPGVWTQVVFDVTANSAQNQTYEGGTYQQIFQGFDNSGIGNMQFGVSIPAGLSGTGPYVFDFDKVNVSQVPEPGAAVLGGLGAAALAMFLRRRS